MYSCTGKKVIWVISLLLIAYSAIFAQAVSDDYQKIISESEDRILMGLGFFDIGQFEMAKKEFSLSSRQLDKLPEDALNYKSIISSSYIKAISDYYIAVIDSDTLQLKNSKNLFWNCRELFMAAEMKEEAYYYCLLQPGIIEYEIAFLSNNPVHHAKNAVSYFDDFLRSKDDYNMNPDFVNIARKLKANSMILAQGEEFYDSTAFLEVKSGLGRALYSLQNAEKNDEGVDLYLLMADAVHNGAWFFWSIGNEAWDRSGVSVYERRKAVNERLDFSDSLLNRAERVSKNSKNVDKQIDNIKARNQLIRFSFAEADSSMNSNNSFDWTGIADIDMHLSVIDYLKNNEDIRKTSLYNMPFEYYQSDFWLGYIDMINGNYPRAIGHFEQCSLKVSPVDGIYEEMLFTECLFQISEATFHIGFTLRDSFLINRADDIYIKLLDPYGQYFYYLDDHNRKWSRLRRQLIIFEKTWDKLESYSKFSYAINDCGFELPDDYDVFFRVAKFYASRGIRYSNKDKELGEAYLKIAEELFLDVIEFDEVPDYARNEANFMYGLFQFLSYTLFYGDELENIDNARKYLGQTEGNLRQEAQLITAITYLFEGDTANAIERLDAQINEDDNLRALFLKSFLVDNCIERASMLETIALSVETSDPDFFLEVMDELNKLDCRDSLSEQPPLIHKPMETSIKFEDIVNLSMSENWHDSINSMKQRGMCLFEKLFPQKEPLFYFDIGKRPEPPIK